MPVLTAERVVSLDDEPIGAKRPARDFFARARDFIPAPDADSVNYTFDMYRGQFEAAGFASPNDLGTILISADSRQIWAAPAVPPADDVLLTRVD